MNVLTRFNPDVLFVVPRFHTNLLGWFYGLTKLEISFRILVQTFGKSEDHTLYHPERIDPHNEDFRVSIFRGFKLSNFLVLINYIRRVQPKLIIFRFELNFTSLVFLMNILLSGKPFVIYQQWPLHGLGLSRKMIRGILLFFLRVPIITPVLSASDSWIGKEVSDKNGQRVLFVPFGVPIRNLSSEISSLRPNIQTLKFLTIGKFQYRKNHLQTIQSFLANSNFANTEATLEIVGEVSTLEHFRVLSEINDFIAAKNLDKKIIISINKEHGEVLKKLESCDVFVLLSDSEPASISNLEAMSFGKPVIIKSGNGTANYLNHGSGGFIVSTPIEFNEGLNYFFEHQDFMDLCKSENLSSVKKLMDPATVATKLLCLKLQKEKSSTEGN